MTIAAVGRGEPGQAVATAADGELEVLAAGELDGGDDVGDAGARTISAGRLSIIPFQIARASS